jgi:class 3 adenylate cyclase
VADALVPSRLGRLFGAGAEQRVHRTERDRYRLRRALASLSAGSLAAFGTLFAIIGQWWWALGSFGCSLIYTLIFLFMSRGRHRLASDVGFAGAMTALPAVALLLGLHTGFLLYSFPLVAVQYLVYRPDERRWRMPVAFAWWAAAIATCSVLSPRIGVALPLAASTQRWLLAFNAVGTLTFLVSMARYFSVLTERAEQELQRERALSEDLLLNMLPRQIAERLKGKPGTIADAHPSVTILFADIVGFTPMSARMTSSALVEVLNEMFSVFDQLAASRGLEKIKTIGDAYMVAGGIPEPVDDHADRVADLALAMQGAIVDFRRRFDPSLAIRIGVHSGPVTAGVIGLSKFSYDLWGDTVNVASRMESHGEPGRIHLTEEARALLEPTGKYAFVDRGLVSVKGRGQVRTFFLELRAGQQPQTAPVVGG